MAFVPAIRTNPAKKHYIPSLAYLETRIDPDQIVASRSSVPSSKKVFRPIDKTEDEIQRQWEYLTMMGRQ